jgi:hypothetical protein
MNLQTDNDMKRVLLFFSLMLLLGNIKGLAQSIVIDPVMIGTLVYSHQEQQGVLKDIQSEETKIRNFQILIQQKMNQIQSLQEKTYNYLSTVNAVVKNGKDIIYASTLARDIAKYQSEAAKYAVGDFLFLGISVFATYTSFVFILQESLDNVIESYKSDTTILAELLLNPISLHHVFLYLFSSFPIDTGKNLSIVT